MWIYLSLLFGLLLLGVPQANADITVIYRKSDKVVGGWVYPGGDVDVKMGNILASEMGGKAKDYATVVVPNFSSTHRPVIQPDGSAKIEVYPVPEKPVEIPIEDLGAGVVGGLAALGGTGLVFLVRKKKK